MTEPEFFLSREARRLGVDRDLRRATHQGEFVRVAIGTYVRSSEWVELTADDRYRLLVRAAAARHPDEQISHDSAAALWRLPGLGRWPSKVHTTLDHDAAGRSTKTLWRHTLGRDGDGVVMDGIELTSLARTVVDVARSAPFARAVGMADDALRGGPSRAAVTKQELLGLLAPLTSERGSARARNVVEFADPGAATLGESLCRVQFRALGLPAPVLQKVFVDVQGRIIPDFYFPHANVAAEFDGHVKYTRERQFQTGLTIDEIVLEEKRRENRLRRLVRDVVRIDWPHALDRRRLASLLREHGLLLQ